MAAIVGCLVLELATLNLGLDDLDEGYFVEHAARVLTGQIPYRDFESLYTPGLTYLHAAVFGLAGEPSIIAMRWVALLARAGVVSLLYVLARPIVGPLWAALAPVFVLAGLDPAPDRWNTHPGWPSTFAALLAVWTTSRWNADPDNGRWLMASGASAALTYLFKQNTGVYISMAIAAFVVLEGRWRMLPWLVAGFVAGTLPWLVPLVLALGGNVQPLAPFVGAVNTGPLFYPPEPLNALAVAALLCACVLVFRTRSEPGAWRLRWYLIAGCALFLTQYPRMDTMHLAWSAPLLLLLGAIFLARLPVGFAALGVAIVAACAVPMLTSRFQPLLGQPLVRIDSVPIARGLLVPEATRSNVEGVVQELRSRTTAGEAIFVYPSSPLLYVAAERPNPTRYAHLYPGFADPTEIQHLLHQLETATVRTVVLDDFWLAIWGPPGDNRPLEDYIHTHFAEVNRFGAYRILERSSTRHPEPAEDLDSHPERLTSAVIPPEFGCALSGAASAASANALLAAAVLIADTDPLASRRCARTLALAMTGSEAQVGYLLVRA